MGVAVFAGGCFWCTEAVFKRVKGVTDVKPGYTGGHVKNPSYREVCAETTGHAEAVKILYDEAIITYRELLEIFFVAHDPTTLNRQGNDVGTQYRSAVFYTDETQKATAEQYMKELAAGQIFEKALTTQLIPFTTFYEAEAYHHDYYNRNSQQPYCQWVIHPKLEKLEKHLHFQ